MTSRTGHAERTRNVDGDNKDYDQFHREQVGKLLSNYGQVDAMWFDHVGRLDWGKRKIKFNTKSTR